MRKTKLKVTWREYPVPRVALAALAHIKRNADHLLEASISGKIGQGEAYALIGAIGDELATVKRMFKSTWH